MKQTPIAYVNYYRSPPPVRAVKLKTKRISGAHWQGAAIIAVIILCSTLLLVGGNLLADHLIASLQADEQRRIDAWWAAELAARADRYAPWTHAKPGSWYTITWGNDHLRIHARGTLQRLSDLPMVGNNIGDFYTVAGQDHLFVWNGKAWFDP